MRIHHLNCGTLCVRGARFVQGHGSLLGKTKMFCHCLLIETQNGLVLVDSGFGTEDVRSPKKRLGRFFSGQSGAVLNIEECALHQIQALGFQAKDVRHILPTHLDLDHAGGLSDFPQARVHVFQTELDAAQRRATWMEKTRYRPAQWAHLPAWQTYSDARGEPWFGFESVRDLPGLPPEILLIPLVGHTRGHAGIAVQTENGWLLHCGDAYFHHQELESGRAPAGLEMFQKIIQMDKAARLRNRERLRELHQKHGAMVQVFSAHDPVEFKRLAHPSSSVA